MLCCGLQAKASQRFFNLTATDVEIDSLLPSFTYSVPLDGDYQDSLYTVSIEYPDFIDMTSSDIAKYNQISGAALPAIPSVHSNIVVDRKKGFLEISFTPLVFRDNRHQILVSFLLKVESVSKVSSVRKAKSIRALSPTTASRYASHSVLASGTWAKIKVPATGVYQLTEAVIRQAGFSDLSKVHIYGYGGNLQNETLDGSELAALDDLKEVPTCTVNGRRLFYAKGPVSWASPTSTLRTRNPYSDEGYYFMTQDDSTPVSVDSTTFLNDVYPRPEDYHTLHEVDNFAWYQGGRKLFENSPIANGSSKTYSLTLPVEKVSGRMSIALSAGTASTATIELNGKTLGTITLTLPTDYDHGSVVTRVFTIDTLARSNTVKISTTSGGPIRLDYIDFGYDQPGPAPDLLNGTFSAPEYVYNITNQDHHADPQADMVIIIPTSQKLLEQAKRLAAFHEEHDSMRVNIVPADELYNEFSSGTPDANAYRRYLKMLYDRATTETDMPKYLLLFGDCAWDNRMNTSDWKTASVDDYLLCYESENSLNDVYCYVDDGWFCSLDDGEGADPVSSDKEDVAVGRFPVTTATEAKAMVDKVINYVKNENAGAWQNTIMFMGDDGNENIHMRDINETADNIAARYPGYQIKKVMWDNYTRVTSSTGNTYPDVTRAIKEQQAAGALIMDYAGHGSPTQISHETVLRLTDFESFTNTNLPLWVTASCDILPYDGSASTIGEAAVLNPNGGAVAFYGTTRTVYTDRNKVINAAFLNHVLSYQNGKPMTLGEAQRLAKNQLISSHSDLTVNKLQYALLGDPAMALNLPTATVVIDSINGMAVSSGSIPTLKAGTVATVKGHVEGHSGFQGLMAALVRDKKVLETCKLNDTSATGASSAFSYYDRPRTLFSGSDSVRAGTFAFSFAIPKDIDYEEGTGLINIYAIQNDRLVAANGATENFYVGGSAFAGNDSIGPSIYCYLNAPSFVNGGKVNTTPYFVAKVSDEDGINTSGNGIGHDLELIIDGKTSQTYVLNDNFRYDLGSYTSGSTYYNLPELGEGAHKLLFRAWDTLNNSSTAQLSFVCVKGLTPALYTVSVTENPANNYTTFIINHDRTGSKMNVSIDVYDMEGRIWWQHTESGVPTSSAYTVNWDLTSSSGSKLQTGVYLYRVRISCDGSSSATKARKLIIIGNN